MTELELSIQSYFGVIQQEDLQIISSFFKPATIRKNEYFLQTGKPCNKMCFIQSGYLRVFKATEEKEVTQWIATPGYFLTDLSSWLFNSPARWTIQALTDSEVFTISREDYQKMAQTIPQWHELEKLFIAKCFTFLEERVYSHLSMTAEERYHFFFEHSRELFNHVPLQYIASMLGMTPETLSRLRKRPSS